VHVNANDVSLSTVLPVASSIQNQLSGRITAIHDDVHPSSQIVVLAHGEQQVLSRVTRKACHALGLKPGMQVWAQIKSVALTEP
jgi:molybdate transport system ATP-binding protein